MKHPYKIISNKEAFRKKVVEASRILAEPVAATLGPEGLPILLKMYDGRSPNITKDGVTVANSIFVKDPVIDTIIQSIKEASRKTNSEAGDGTTTAIVLANALIQESMKYIETGAISPQALRNALLKLQDPIIEMMKSWATPVSTEESMKSVAMISSNADEKVADAVVSAIKMAGDFGLISINEGFQSEIEVKHYEGFRLNMGFRKLGPIGPSFITHPERQTVEFTQPKIVIYDGDLINGSSIANLLNSITSNGQNAVPVIIIAYSFGTGTMEPFVIGRQMGWNVLPIACPIYASGDTRRLVLDDLAAWIGCAPIDANSKDLMGGLAPDKRQWDGIYIGSCDRVVVNLDTSIFYGGKGHESSIIERVQAINANKAIAASQYEREIFDHRLAMMTGGVVHISVGAPTEFAMKERKDRVDDALSAVRAAIAEGIVPGGGNVFLRLSCTPPYSEIFSDKNLGIAKKILDNVFEVPLRQLAINAGESPDLVANAALTHLANSPLSGWNARDHMFVPNMIECGIIDPLKVVKSAFINAISIAMSLLCGGGSVVFAEPEANEKQDIDGFYVNE